MQLTTGQLSCMQQKMVCTSSNTCTVGHGTPLAEQDCHYSILRWRLGHFCLPQVLTDVTAGCVILFGEGGSKHVAPQLLDGRSFVLQAAKLPIAADAVPLPCQQGGTLNPALYHLTNKTNITLGIGHNHRHTVDTTALPYYCPDVDFLIKLRSA